MSINRCPFCHNENFCSVNSNLDSNNNCWCMNENVPRALIDLLPSNSLHKDCICQNCIKLYKLDAKAFKESLNGQT